MTVAILESRLIEETPVMEGMVLKSNTDWGSVLWKLGSISAKLLIVPEDSEMRI